jgi:hypothetical protein
MKLKIRGKVWEFVRVPMKETDGLCDAPTVPGKKIKVDSRLHGERELEVIIHEVLHAAHWDLSEEAVDEAARDLARALWRIGYKHEAR